MDVFNAVEIDPANADKLLKHLEKIKQAQSNSSELGEAVNAAMKEFRQFFLSYGEPYFPAHELLKNQTPEAAIYNENIEMLAEDLDRLYAMVSTSAASSLTAYNYSSIVSNEVKNAAELSASKVLDLSILSDFVKGTTIVAGDDFINSDKIDSSHSVESTKAELIHGASSVGLKAVDINIVSTPKTKITVTAVMPAGTAGQVSTTPTPDNLERFYEGRFFAPIGQQNAEGGKLKITYIADPSNLPSSVTSTSINGGEATFTAAGGSFNADGEELDSDGAQDAANQNPGFFAVLPATDAEKEKIRAYMVDGNPDTWWECEYVYETEPLIDPFDLATDDVLNSDLDSSDTDNPDEIDG